MIISRLLLKDHAWFLFLGLVLIVLLTSAVKWMLDHPYAISWDEALYFNTVLDDQIAIRESGLRGLRSQIQYADRGRPPAYRVLAIPFYFAFGFSPVTVRLVSLGFLSLGLVLLYLTTRKFASPKCAVLSVLIFCLSPDVLFASAVFYTEYPLFLATTGTFYFLISSVESKSGTSKNWIGLGLSIGLGLLAKASFLLVAAPVLSFALVAGRIRGLAGPAPAFALKAGALGALVAARWWWLNTGFAAGIVRGSRYDVESSLGAPSFGTWLSWFFSIAQSLLGHGVFLVVALIVFTWIWKRFMQQDARLDAVQRTVLVACACGILPLALVHLTGTNHLLRYLCPTLVPLAIAVALVAHVVGWSSSPVLLGTSGLAFLVQLLLIIVPVYCPNRSLGSSGLANGRLPWRTFARLDQWDWKPLRKISRAAGFEEPRISLLGTGKNLGPEQIRYVWAVDGKLKTTARPLWRYSSGPIDWDKVMESVGESDIVLTAPRFTGLDTGALQPDNQHNVELANRLTRDPRFRGPVTLWVGRFEPVEVDVFVRLR
jgi:4-amino-4-deoxy-L-arabinose transferase-like glycosyltransferase